ncbi:MAG: BatD family protein, partial [Planctomycetes bacterium]|nr:BatD family protein [Planctomycetota bacterium]
MSSMVRRVLGFLVGLACSWGVHAQETLEVVGPKPALVALGDESVVEFVIENGSGQPGELKVPQVPGLTMRLDGPQESSWARVINGRRTAGRTLRWVLRLRPRRVGHFEIPSFRFDTGSREQVVQKLVLDCEKSVANASRGFLELTAIPDRVYVGEPVQFVFDVGVDARTTPDQTRGLVHVFVEQPWFESPEGMVSVEGADGVAGGSKVQLGFNNVAAEAAYTPNYVRGALTYHRFTFTRTLMPTRPGTFEIGDSTMKFEFGGPRSPFDARRAKSVFVYGEPLTVEVLPLPEEGRPAGFGNAVGRFQLEAAADKHHVRVGDSVKLTLKVVGKGNTEFLEPPALGELDGLHLLGRNDNRGKDSVVVEYDLTPLRDDVTELPSVTWSYFDTTPGGERYITVHTDSIPIVVDPPAEGGGLAALPGDEEASVVVGVDDIYDMKPIEASDPVPLEATPGPGRSAAWVLLPWAISLAFAAFWRARRRRRADVRGRRAASARRHYRELRDTDPTAALAAYLADRLDWPEAAVIGPDLAERL